MSATAVGSINNLELDESKFWDFHLSTVTMSGCCWEQRRCVLHQLLCWHQRWPLEWGAACFMERVNLCLHVFNRCTKRCVMIRQDLRLRRDPINWSIGWFSNISVKPLVLILNMKYWKALKVVKLSSNPANGTLMMSRSSLMVTRCRIHIKTLTLTVYSILFFRLYPTQSYEW